MYNSVTTTTLLSASAALCSIHQTIPYRQNANCHKRHKHNIFSEMIIYTLLMIMFFYKKNRAFGDCVYDCEKKSQTHSHTHRGSKTVFSPFCVLSEIPSTCSNNRRLNFS